MRAAMHDASRRRGAKIVSVRVAISRGVSADGRGRFEARACITRRAVSVGRQWTRSVGRGTDRCGRLGWGSSPSKALNVALRRLAAIKK
jgi:hypothetical protein